MNPDYTDQWAKLRKSERLASWTFWTYVPGTALLGIPLSKAVGSDWPFSIIGISWFLAVFVTNRIAFGFNCPRCEKPFFYTWWFYNGFAKKCVHCGLAKWASDNH